MVAVCVRVRARTINETSNSLMHFCSYTHKEGQRDTERGLDVYTTCAEYNIIGLYWFDGNTYSIFSNAGDDGVELNETIRNVPQQ